MGAYLFKIVLRSFAVCLRHSGNTDSAAAMAARVSLTFIIGMVARTAPVAGLKTCKDTRVLPIHCLLMSIGSNAGKGAFGMDKLSSMDHLDICMYF
jgi:hypothetical protein